MNNVSVFSGSLNRLGYVLGAVTHIDAELWKSALRRSLLNFISGVCADYKLTVRDDKSTEISPCCDPLKEQEWRIVVRPRPRSNTYDITVETSDTAYRLLSDFSYEITTCRCKSCQPNIEATIEADK